MFVNYFLTINIKNIITEEFRYRPRLSGVGWFGARE